jgi:CheY-like chemotaxis protein
MSAEVSSKSPVKKLSRTLPLKILIAEDNSINQKLLVMMLKMLGYKADAVADGMEVLKQIRKKTYDLILLDIQMPQLDGVETVQELIKMQLKNMPRIIAITAYAMAGDREKYLSVGMNGYLSKPFRMEELVKEMKRVMK